jgi:adenylosuccinate synthase
LGKSAVGTTGKGIGPTYASRVDRSGATLADIFDEKLLETKLRSMADGYRKRYGHLATYDVEKEIASFKGYREQLAELVIDEVPLLQSARKQGLKLVVEGAQAAGLDIAFGVGLYHRVVPLTAVDLSLRHVVELLGRRDPRRSEHRLAIDQGGHRRRQGIVGLRFLAGCAKRQSATRVGSGPFPTEQLNDVGNQLQSVGKEIGVTTGRTRRTGWLDLVQVRLAQDVNSFTGKD